MVILSAIWKAEEMEGGYQFEMLVKPEENQVYLLIDGKNIPLHDFGRALTAYEGFKNVCGA